MCASCVKAGDYVAVAVISDRKLGLVAVTERLVHSENRRNLDICEAADSGKVVADKICFEGELRRI